MPRGVDCEVGKGARDGGCGAHRGKGCKVGRDEVWGVVVALAAAMAATPPLAAITVGAVAGVVVV